VVSFSDPSVQAIANDIASDELNQCAPACLMGLRCIRCLVWNGGTLCLVCLVHQRGQGIGSAPRTPSCRSCMQRSAA